MERQELVERQERLAQATLVLTETLETPVIMAQPELEVLRAIPAMRVTLVILEPLATADLEETAGRLVAAATVAPLV